MANARALAQALRSKGRGGDTDVVHVNPAEKQMLKAMGGAGTINPHTGLEEYRGGLLSRLIDPIFGSNSWVHQDIIRPIGTAIAAAYSGPFAPLTVAGINQLEAAGQGKSFLEGLKEAGIGAALAYGGGLVSDAFSGAGSSAASDAATPAITDAASAQTANEAVQAGTDAAAKSAANIGSASQAANAAGQLGGNTTGLNLGTGNAGALNVGGQIAADTVAQDAAQQALKRKLLATALKQGVKLAGDAMAPKPLPVFTPPAGLIGSQAPQQPQRQRVADNPYASYIYGYNPNAT